MSDRGKSVERSGDEGCGILGLVFLVVVPICYAIWTVVELLSD